MGTEVNAAPRTNAAEEIVEEGAMTVADATAFSGLGRTRLYNAMATGRLAFIQYGRRRLIPRKALRELLAEELVGGESDLTNLD